MLSGEVRNNQISIHGETLRKYIANVETRKMCGVIRDNIIKFY